MWHQEATEKIFVDGTMLGYGCCAKLGSITCLGRRQEFSSLCKDPHRPHSESILTYGLTAPCQVAVVLRVILIEGDCIENILHNGNYRAYVSQN